MSLRNFDSAVKTSLLNNPNIPYKVSGVACITKLGGSVIYSASLVHTDKNKSVIMPENLQKVFAPIVVQGYAYRGVETITFISAIPNTLPLWRAQVKYVSN